MTEENRTERIAMMWTKTLKEAVRTAGGPGGMTDFVIEAVEEKLASMAPSPEEERELAELAALPRVIKSKEERRPPVAPPVAPEPEGAHGVQAAISMTRNDRDDLFARVMAKAGNADELEKNKAMFKPASEVKAVKGQHALRIVEDDACPTCGSELIDGECWTCG